MERRNFFTPRPYLPERGTFPMVDPSGSAANSVGTTEQRAMSDEEGLRELNPFKSAK